MFRKTHIIGLALVVVAMALATPVAVANDGLVDDWFRAAKPAPEASIGLIDVTAQDVSRPLATPAVAERLVDDWFRGAKPVPEASIGLIDVTAQEVSRPLTTAVVTAAPVSASSTTSFAWGEFGIGAAAMLGAVLLLVGLGAAAMRHRGGQLTTS
jgi:hypothetical protein